MKKHLFALVGVIVACIVLMISCRKESSENNGIKVTDIRFSECMSHYDSPADKGFYSPDSVEVSVKEGQISVVHYNLMVNCGYEDVHVGVSQSNDTLRVKEWETGPTANCLCDINNSFTIQNLPAGAYHVIFESCTPQPIEIDINTVPL